MIDLVGCKVIPNDRSQLINPRTGRNLELDIWIPSMNKAIEFNGSYWHSLPRTQIIDEEKHWQCKSKGIDLLVVKERDWRRNKSSVVNYIKEWLLNEN